MKTWLGILALYLLLALAAGLGGFTPELPAPGEAQVDQAPSAEAWFGTDTLGRDLFAQTIQGIKVALSVGSLAASLAILLGALFGILSGWYRGPVDGLILWLSSSVAAIPGILLVLVLSWMLGGSYVGVFVAVGLVSWVSVYRLVRIEVQRLQAEPFVDAARLQGAPTGFLMLRHLVPNLTPVLLPQFLLHFLYAVKAEAILSFLGIGMQGHTSWGTMIADAWAYDDLGHGRWWRLAAATGAMAILILALQRIAMRLEARK
ncbi:MAG: ABC transporter permease [Planctomycetota bacterium]